MEDASGGWVPGPEQHRGRADQAGDLAHQSDLVTLVSVQYWASGDYHLWWQWWWYYSWSQDRSLDTSLKMKDLELKLQCLQSFLVSKHPCQVSSGRQESGINDKIPKIPCMGLIFLTFGLNSYEWPPSLTWPHAGTGETAGPEFSPRHNLRSRTNAAIVMEIHWESLTRNFPLKSKYPLDYILPSLSIWEMWCFFTTLWVFS